MYGLKITLLFNSGFLEDNSLGSKHVEGTIKQNKGLTDRVEYLYILKVSFRALSNFFSGLSKQRLQVVSYVVKCMKMYVLLLVVCIVVSCLVCIVITLCVFLVLRVYSCFYFRCQTAG